MTKLLKYSPVFALFGVLLALAIWKSEVLHIVDRVPSPDGRYTATVLEIEKEDIRDETKKVPAVSVQLAWPGGGSSTSLESAYDGLYWSPDSTMYLLEMTPLSVHGLSLELSNLKTNSAAIAMDAAHKFLRLGLDAQSCTDNHMQAIIASRLDRELWLLI